jgi:hypothetical protein
MSQNDLVILNEILETQRRALEPSLTPAEYFEIFVAELVLRDFAELNGEEVRSGIVAGTLDGGIDSIHLFVNGLLIEEDTVLPNFKKSISIDLVIAQAKTDNGFGETPVDKLTNASTDLLDTSKDLSKLTSIYNPELLSAAQRFITTYKQLAIKRPALSVHYFYASKGEEVHPNVRRKASNLERMIVERFPNTKCEFRFLGARSLLELAYKTPPQRLELPCLEILPAGRASYICTVALSDYVKFITDEHNQLLIRIFESNVRDYQGSTEVNDAIHTTLAEPREDEDFWWLNNGITIVATEASVVGKTLTIDDPQIVNGLQTSREMYEVFGDQKKKDERRVLVRVIAAVQAETRDRIITATNSQNYIPPSSLRATETVHRDIEEFFKTHGLYYDRRKNFYKNQGKSSESIVNIPSLAQSVMAIVLQKPDYARARPSSLLKDDDDYHKIFAAAYSPHLYLFCAKVTKEVDRALRAASTTLSRKDQNNIRFYVAMVVAAKMARTPKPSIDALTKLVDTTINPKLVETATNEVYGLYRELGGTDQLAKGPDLASKLKERLDSELVAKAR